MSDSIYRHEAIKTITSYNGVVDKSVAKRLLLQMPSAEPEIIHCKDCKYWTHINRTNRYWCKTDDGLFDLNPLPDDFCSRAKRRT